MTEKKTAQTFWRYVYSHDDICSVKNILLRLFFFKSDESVSGIQDAALFLGILGGSAAEKSKCQHHLHLLLILLFISLFPPLFSSFYFSFLLFSNFGWGRQKRVNVSIASILLVVLLFFPCSSVFLLLHSHIQ